LTLVAYEGGQHLVPWNSTKGENRNATVKRLAQYDERMRQVYRQLDDIWNGVTGGAHFNWFAHVGAPSNFGYWGMLESLGQDRTVCRTALQEREDWENPDTLLVKSCPKWDYVMDRIEAQSAAR
jgi:hypothetical protein